VIYAGDVNILGGSTHTVNRNTEALVVSSKEVGLAVNAEEAKRMIMSCGQHGIQNHDITRVHISCERVEQVKYWGTTLTNKNSIQEEIKCRLISGNACSHLVQNLLSSC